MGKPNSSYTAKARSYVGPLLTLTRRTPSTEQKRRIPMDDSHDRSVWFSEPLSGEKLIRVPASYHWSKIGRSSYLDADAQDRCYRTARAGQALNKEGLLPRRHADVCCSAGLPHVLRVHTFFDFRGRVAGRIADPRLLRVVARQSAKHPL